MAAQVPLRWEGKAVVLGVYPDVSLKEARDRRDAARKLLADGVDPSENRKAKKSLGPPIFQQTLNRDRLLSSKNS